MFVCSVVTKTLIKVLETEKVIGMFQTKVQ